MDNINTILTFREASERWNLDSSTLRKIVKRKKLKEGIDYRKSGCVWLITETAMKRVFGPEPLVLYVSTDLDKVLNKAEYIEMVKREFKNIKEASENEWDYKQLELSIDPEEEFGLINLDDIVRNEFKEQLGFYNYETSLDNNSADNILDYGSLDFNLTNSHMLRINFEIIARYSDNEEENEYIDVLAEDSLIKIKNIELI